VDRRLRGVCGASRSFFSISISAFFAYGRFLHCSLGLF
jgi:hypothetical protein